MVVKSDEWIKTSVGNLVWVIKRSTMAIFVSMRMLFSRLQNLIV